MHHKTFPRVAPQFPPQRAPRPRRRSRHGRRPPPHAARRAKLYGPSLEGDRRYSPAECNGAIKTSVQGHPDPKHVSTSYAERNNLNVRMHSRRMTRLTNSYSKKMENHAHAMALHFLYYNFVRTHQMLRTTPAMAAGVTKRLWEISDIVEMLEAWEKGN
jgi:hypothetical protein